LWNRPESLFKKMVQDVNILDSALWQNRGFFDPPHRKTQLLWNRPESLFKKMVQDVNILDSALWQNRKSKI
jgi:hypothetical protein